LLSCCERGRPGGAKDRSPLLHLRVYVLPPIDTPRHALRACPQLRARLGVRRRLGGPGSSGGGGGWRLAGFEHRMAADTETWQLGQWRAWAPG
jgi:hypothetical protein